MAQIVTVAEWQAARAELLKEEKEATRLLSSIASKRQSLPVVQVKDPSRFKFYDTDEKGNAKTLTLLDLFEGRRQLILYHFMLAEADKEACTGCSYLMDHIPHDEALNHMHSRDTTFVAAARASPSKIQKFKKYMGWTFPFYSSKDLFAEVDATGEEVTWKPGNGYFGFACFIREGNHVFHTYSTTDRGCESMLTTYALLDMTKMGRQEVGNEMGRFKLHPKYDQKDLFPAND